MNSSTEPDATPDVSRSEGVWSIALSPLLLFSSGLLLALGVFRILLCAWQSERVADAGGISEVLLRGIRTDVVAISIWLLPVVIPTVLFGVSSRIARAWRTLLWGWLTLGACFFAFSEVAPFPFIVEYDTRPNRLFFEYLQYPREVGAMLIRGYKLELVVGSTALLFSAWLSGRYLWRSLGRERRLSVPMRLLVLAPLSAALFLGARSSLQHRPFNPSSVAFCGDHLVNALCLNSGYSILYDIYRMKDEANAADVYGEMPREDVLKEVRATFHRPRGFDGFPNADIPTLHHQTPPTVRDRPFNLVIVLEESLGARFVKPLGGEDIAPRLSALRGEGLWFDQMYATGTRSVRGIEAVVTGFPPTPARSVVKLEKSQQGFFSLASLLQNRGYRTQFIYGGESHFDNMSGFLTGNGFDEVYDRSAFEAPSFEGSWGVCDEEAFAKAHEVFEANGEEPFFALVFSVSNHSPWEFPDGRIKRVEEPKATMRNAVKYADHALGEFVDQMRASTYGDRTVILVVADHDARVFGADLVPIEHFHIPAVILGPDVPRRIEAHVASQVDLPPTLLSLIGVESDHPMMGTDFTSIADDYTGHAMLQYGQNQAFLMGNREVVLTPHQPPQSFSIRGKGLSSPSELDLELAHCARAHALLPSFLYRERSYRLP